MEIDVLNEQNDLSIDINSVVDVVKEVLRHENRQCDEVSVNFVTENEICSLHEEYFDDPSPTDCISFPMDEDDEDPSEYCMLGDVFVCPKTAIGYAEKNQGDPYEETTLYVVHGMLHLMGYDDILEDDIEKMRNAEHRHMSNLKKLDLSLHK